jgi:hypothetical protein
VLNIGGPRGYATFRGRRPFAANGGTLASPGWSPGDAMPYPRRALKGHHSFCDALAIGFRPFRASGSLWLAPTQGSTLGWRIGPLQGRDWAPPVRVRDAWGGPGHVVTERKCARDKA